MKKLLNTLYILSEDAYARLDGENIVLHRGDEETARFPLHTIENIVSFSYRGASPQLMGACREHHVHLSFYTPGGRFLASMGTGLQGNVLLRKTQFRTSDSETKSCLIARHFVLAKVFNCKAVLDRALRDYPLRVDTQRIAAASRAMSELLPVIQCEEDLDTLRGHEGAAAETYFGVFDELVLQNKDTFIFTSRSRQPPLDPLNSLLSFAYSLLGGACAAALEGVGLDPCVGFLHRDRPGRRSLALDLMEEFRGVIADRFVLTLINNRMVHPRHFITSEDGACLLDDDGRKVFLKAWQERKQESLTHPFLKEKISWGLLPHAQALLLARALRGDYDAYPPFFWK